MDHRAESLQNNWVSYWQQQISPVSNMPSSQRQMYNLIRFVINNWSDYFGNRTIMGTHATRLGFGIQVGVRSRWYQTLDIVDPAHSSMQANLTQQAYANFWKQLFDRQRRSFRDLCERGYHMETILRHNSHSGVGSGSAAINELNRRHWAPQLATLQQYFSSRIHRWQIFNDSLETMDGDRLTALATCYHSHWSVSQRVPSGNILLARAGIRGDWFLGGAGDLSCLPPGSDCSR